MLRHSADHETSLFDGVVIMLETIIEDIEQLSFEAWRNVLDSFLQDVARREKRQIAPPSFEEYVDIFLFSVEESSVERSVSHLSLLGASPSASFVSPNASLTATPYVGLHKFLQTRGIVLPTGSPADAEVMETHYGLANAKVSELEHLTTTRDE